LKKTAQKLFRHKDYRKFAHRANIRYFLIRDKLIFPFIHSFFENKTVFSGN
jgi:hypothetical protein